MPVRTRSLFRGGGPLRAEAPARASLGASLSPGATGAEGSHVIEGAGRAARDVAQHIQRLTDLSTYPLALARW